MSVTQVEISQNWSRELSRKELEEGREERGEERGEMESVIRRQERVYSSYQSRNSLTLPSFSQHAVPKAGWAPGSKAQVLY